MGHKEAVVGVGREQKEILAKEEELFGKRSGISRSERRRRVMKG